MKKKYFKDSAGYYKTHDTRRDGKIPMHNFEEAYGQKKKFDVGGLLWKPKPIQGEDYRMKFGPPEKRLSFWQRIKKLFGK